MQNEPAEEPLLQFPYGLYVVSSFDAKTPKGIVANWVSQLSFRPALVGVAIEADSKMKSYIETSGLFAVNFLPAGGKGLARRFLKETGLADEESMDGSFSIPSTGGPFLKDASASIGCKVVQTIPTGDHILFVGEVVESIVNRHGKVLTLKETGWRYFRR